VSRVDKARNIDAVIDMELNMIAHVNSVVRSCYSHLRQISHIRPFLSQEAASTLVNSIITSRLDYVNSLLFGLPSCVIRKLELVQNNAARLICKKKKRDHMTPVLRELHWLLIDLRIQFKINLMTYKALNGLAPSYLSSMLSFYQPSRTLRLSSQGNLVEKSSKSKRTGDRAYSLSLPNYGTAYQAILKKVTLWNHLKLH